MTRFSLRVSGFLLVAALMCPPVLPAAGGLFGRVFDQATGEPLRKVRIMFQGTAHEAVSADDGSSRIDGVPAGDYTLYVSTIGYRLLKRDLRVEEGGAQEVVLYLGQEDSTISEAVHVTAPDFEEVEKAIRSIKRRGRSGKAPTPSCRHCPLPASSSNSSNSRGKDRNR